jgi:hypothetical protein
MMPKITRRYPWLRKLQKKRRKKLLKKRLKKQQLRRSNFFGRAPFGPRPVSFLSARLPPAIFADLSLKTLKNMSIFDEAVFK